nr:7TM diverse intracellular signaling domain-containing protein [uncultured Dyadobacter sp.]
MKQLYLFIFMMLCQRVTGAQLPVIEIGREFSNSNLKGYAVYFKDTTNALTLGQVLREVENGRGTIPTYTVPNLGFENATHWIFIRVKNVALSPIDLVAELDFPYTFLDDFSFLVIRDHVVLKSVSHLSWHSSKTSLELPHRNPAFPLLVQPGDQYTIGMRIWKKDGVLITPLKLQSKRHFLIATQSQQIINGLISGMQALAILVGVCFFILSRQLHYLYYAAYVFGITGFVLADQGQLNIYFLNVYNVLAGPNSWAFFTLIAVASHTFFTIQFLQIQKNKYPFLIYTSWLLNGASLLFSLFLAFGLQLSDFTYQVAVVMVLVYVLLVFIYLIIGLRSKLNEAYLYLAAVSTFFFTVIMICLGKLDIIPEYQFVINLLHYSPLIEVCILCVGLVYGFHSTQKNTINHLMEIAALRSNVTLAVIQTQESERLRISQDLHDDVGNTLAAAKGLIGTMRSRIAEPSAAASFEKAFGLIEKAGEDLRAITHNLMPIDFTRYRLTEVLRQTTMQAGIASDIHFEYIEQGKARRFSADKELIIYRIFTELIANVLKHSRARNAYVQMLFQEYGLVLIVEDDGIGNSQEKEGGTDDGVGLKNVASRAKYIRAKLSVDMHNKGTCVILEMPYD